MRKINSDFKTNFISEEGTFLQNKDYFAFVELDNYACYVIADGIDDDLVLDSANIVVESIIRNFTENPSMKKSTIKKYLNEANDELIKRSKNVRLKASVTILITNYNKVRYAVVGNTRFYLFRDGVIRHKSKDQSLTQELVDKEEISLYTASKHIERNNLYSYLGENILSKPYISKKLKLVDGDTFSLLTKGIWENIDEYEMLDALDNGKEIDEILGDIEEMMLSKQPKELENYTLSLTFVDKIYINPKRNKLIKKIILTAIPILLVLTIGLVIFNIKRKEKINNINEMNGHQSSAAHYIKDKNMPKANEEYKQAFDIAKKYKLEKEKSNFDRDYKYTDIILQGDASLKDKKYEDALDKYLLALEQAEDVDNLAKDYILEKLDIVKNCIKVMDLLELGDESLEAGNKEEAEKNYKEAKNLATDYYLKDERKEAMDKLKDLYTEKAAEDDKKKKEDDDKKKQEEEKKKSDEEGQKKAIDLRKNGDLSYMSGDYISAKMYYTMARQSFEELNLHSLANDLEAKIQLMDRKINEVASKRSEAEKYEKEADNKYAAGDPNSAKILYLLAKEIYEKEGLLDESKKIEEKLAVVEKAMSNN